MADNQQMRITLDVAQEETNDGFLSPAVTPSVSTGTVIEQMAKTSLNSGALTTKQASKRKDRDDDPTPSFSNAKRNRDYLPKESKPVYFELKKHFKKKAQWTAHQQFMKNCANSGKPPRSLMWNPIPPWSFNSLELNKSWSSATLKAQTELCNIISKDCALKAAAQHNSILALLNDLKGLIPLDDYNEIVSELESTFYLMVDKLHAEKILSRSKFTAKVSTKTPTDRRRRSSSSNPPPSKRNRRNTGGNTRNQSNPKVSTRNNNQRQQRSRGQPRPQNQLRNNRNDISKHMQELTRALAAFKKN